MEAGNISIDQGYPPLKGGGRLKPLSREEWDKFTPKMQWDVKVALRGPDLAMSDTTKWFTTSVIRGKMRDVSRVGGLINDDLNLILIPSSLSSGRSRPNPPVIIDEQATATGGWKRHKLIEGHQNHDSCAWCEYVEKLIEYLDSTPRFDGGHFFQHVAEAADILSIPRAFIPSDVWLRAQRTGHTRAGLEYLSYLKSLPPSEGMDDMRKELKRHLKPFIRESE